MFKRFPFVNNHGDFVHLDALREWFRGVVSLESFLKSKNDKAIVKDMHFTDETTSVDFIDTKDDTEKTETLCEYLTSDVYDKTNPCCQFNKVDKITVIKDSRGENFINMREKATQEERLGVIRSNVPIAYDATDDFSTSQNRSAYLGFTNRSIKIYSEDNLKIIKEYNFCSKETLSDCNPFSSITNQATSEILNFEKTNFLATVVGDVVIGGQIMYIFNNPIRLQAGKSIVLQLTPASMGTSKFADTVYPKFVMTPNNSNVIASIMKNSSFPLVNSTPTYITLYNTSGNDVSINYLHITF